MTELFHVNILKDRMNEIRSRNPKYSLRAYSKSLSLDPSTLSKVLSGQRNIPASSLSQVLKKLNLSAAQEKNFVESVSDAHKLTSQKPKAKLEESIVLDEFKHEEVIGNWEYYAILNLIELDNFVPTYEHIANRLGLELVRAENIVKSLLEVGLLDYCNEKRWKRSYRSVTTTNNKASSTLKKAHRQELQLAAEALYQRELTETGFYSITVQTNFETVEAIKLKSFNFIKKIMKDLESGPKEEVYQVGLQIFPLTKKD